jgi:hypothetical protein
MAQGGGGAAKRHGTWAVEQCERTTHHMLEAKSRTGASSGGAKRRGTCEGGKRSQEAEHHIEEKRGGTRT